MVWRLRPATFAISTPKPTEIVITGIDSMKILAQALEHVKTFRPMTEKQMSDLLARSAKAAADGRFERFKTTNAFDTKINYNISDKTQP